MVKHTIAGTDFTKRIGQSYTLDGKRSGELIGIRQEVLDLFNEPKLLLRTSNMNALLGDIVEAQAGNVSSDSEELTIIGGTSSATGTSWMYWNLPVDASRVYAKVYINSVDAQDVIVQFCNADASTWKNPPDFYGIYLTIGQSAGDLRFLKNISGSATQIAAESVDLSYNTYYLIEFYWEYGVQKVWRDNSLKFNLTDTDISSIRAVRLVAVDGSTSEAQSGKFKGEVIIIYE